MPLGQHFLWCTVVSLFSDKRLMAKWMWGNYLQISREILFWFMLLCPPSRISKCLCLLETGDSSPHLSTWICMQINFFGYQGVCIPRFQFRPVSDEAPVTAYGKKKSGAPHHYIYIYISPLNISRPKQWGFSSTVYKIQVAKEFV